MNGRVTFEWEARGSRPGLRRDGLQLRARVAAPLERVESAQNQADAGVSGSDGAAPRVYATSNGSPTNCLMNWSRNAACGSQFGFVRNGRFGGVGASVTGDAGPPWTALVSSMEDDARPSRHRFRP